MKPGAYLLVVMLAGLTPARAAEQSAGTVVRAVQIVEDGGVTRVTIEADGPLPLPLHESLSNPPRIYFDLEGVTHKVRATTAAPGRGVVSRVRVALRQVSPNVTRVVLDLTRLEAYSVNNDERPAGRIRVVVGSASATPPAPAARETVRSPAPPISTNSSSVAPARIAAVPPPPMPAANSTPAKVEAPAAAAPTPSPAIAKPSTTRSPVLSPQTPRPGLPVNEVLAYRKQVFGELLRMEALRALVARIDGGETVGFDALASAAQEFTDLRRNLEAMQPSAALAVTHDLLMTSCTLGAMASRLGIDAGQDSSAETRQRAAATAAGSLMLFDRACTDIGCPKPQR